MREKELKKAKMKQKSKDFYLKNEKIF